MCSVQFVCVENLISFSQQRRKLRIFISHQFLDADSESEETTRLIPHWELRIEGRLLNEVFLQSYKYAVSLLYLCVQAGERPDTKAKLKFTSFFKSVIIELDKDMYGPDNHLIEVTMNYFWSLITLAGLFLVAENTQYSGE